MRRIYNITRTPGFLPPEDWMVSRIKRYNPFQNAPEYTLCSECDEFVALNADGWNFDHQCREYQPDWDLIGKERDYDC